MEYKVMDGNSACTHISYMFSDAASIYPITPASPMSEKVKEIAVKKGEVLKAKAEDLVRYAKEKGTPVLEKTAKDLKKKTASVVREVLAKLEEE